MVTNAKNEQHDKKSKWREQTVTLLPGADVVTTVYFDDTKPNHAAITNNTEQIIYVHTSPGVSENKWLIFVTPGTTKVLPRPLGFHELFLSTTLTEKGTARVESWEEEFSVKSVPQTMDIVQLGQMSGDVGITKMPPLPAGDKHIGNVSIDGTVSLGDCSIPQTSPIPTREAGINDFRIGGLSISTTAVECKSGSAVFPNRKELTIYPHDTQTIYWGKKGVTTGTGAPLTPNDAPITFKLHNASPSIYAVCDNDVTVRVLEVS
ncbi:hypothetical protein [Bacillus velezensis]|uniref:hypothetical protein n=1 Tax=Bacillus velezensis TaxID=492670 RepID=UPI003EBB867C